MKGVARLTAAYALFAAIATAFNLGVQWVVLHLWPAEFAPTGPLAVLAALVCGTGIGLVIKYLLDKRWIFRDASSGAKVHAKKFALYSAMGLVTTLIFWVFEFACSRIDPGGPLIYEGGAVGLAIGYLVKYQLDRRFVFKVGQ